MIPVGNQVVIDREKRPETTKSGKLFLPDRLQEDLQENRGVVVAVGPGKWGRRFELARGSGLAHEHGHGELIDEPIRLPMTLKVGDYVIYQHYTAIGVPDGFLGDDAKGTEFSDDDDRELLLISEDSVLVVIEDAEEDEDA